MAVALKILPSTPYNGPDFSEFCVAAGEFLPASRDRIACSTCVLGDLCQAGFEEQVRRAFAGEKPELATDITLNDQFDPIEIESVLSGLSRDQINFALKAIGVDHEKEG